ncbi:adenylyltransferase and sulfurtransferase MOCS3 [Belonocnema kinseyi]|uniref:adenylyltransferase and sulfurtransferase MOCS3 n=1 Tax=Belonocnema kinseyi TaxID=2817044 RepID=UPI00143D97A6|nr:adenylyltransferase and sulfurtransferase MOCS3 [Belonocnema kinseyi]XP_033212972.1 adenylyltransferase and sulfurtransferase MOCS3 [Belonocnema kinseyi]
MEEELLIEEIRSLQKLLLEKETRLADLKREKQILQANGLNNEEIARYSRQILLPEISVKGQVRLKNASVLIVGAGGLGCPSALYLAGAGIGHIGIVDYDDIEINNLHRQILFSSADIGTPKVEAVKVALKRHNSSVKVTPYKMQIKSDNALNIIKDFDVVLDATDNVATRYLLNDACVISGKPLISGSALKFEGQLTVYNYDGPCYRCIFPKPPPPQAVTNCSDGGILGTVVGVIGVLQAQEAIKIILNLPGVLSGRLLLFDGLETTFRNIRLRLKNPDCLYCGQSAKKCELIDYEQFCGAQAVDKNPDLKVLKNYERITVDKYNEIACEKSHVLIDVRSPEEFEICRLKKSINIPISDIDKESSLDTIKSEIYKTGSDVPNVFVLCRRGNDSQKAVRILQNVLPDQLEIKDIVGGLHAWATKIDLRFPVY